MKRDRRRYRGWGRNHVLAHGTAESSTRRLVYCSRASSRAFSASAPRCNVEIERLGRRDLVVNVDFVEHRQTDDAVLGLSHRSVPESWRLKPEAIPSRSGDRSEALARPVRDRLPQPAECVAHAVINRLKTLDVGALVRRLARRLLLGSELVEQRRWNWHGIF